MGQEHSRIHLETSSAIMTQLPVHFFHSIKSFPLSPYEIDRSKVAQNSLVSINGGPVRAGRPLKGTENFGWDNEFGNGDEINISNFQVDNLHLPPTFTAPYFLSLLITGQLNASF